MSGRREKLNREAIIKTFDLTYQKVLNDLRAQLNAYPFKIRLQAAWRILWRKF